MCSLELRDADRTKGADAYVQRDERAGNAAAVAAFEQFGREVQAGRWRGDRAGPLGERRLVMLPVEAGPQLAADIRRQRHGAELLEQRDGRPVNRSGGGGVGGGGSRGPNSLSIALEQGQLQSRRRLGAVSGAITRVSSAWSLPPEWPISRQRPAASVSRNSPSHLPPVAFRVPNSRAGDDPRVVEDEAVAGPQNFRQVADVAVLEASGRAIDNEQTRGVAAGQGLRRDQLVGQFVVVGG